MDYIGRYILFIRRVSDRCQKIVRYLLMIQCQILFLNLLNKCQMKSNDESPEVFRRPIWQIKDSAYCSFLISYFMIHDLLSHDWKEIFLFIVGNCLLNERDCCKINCCAMFFTLWPSIIFFRLEWKRRLKKVHLSTVG